MRYGAYAVCREVGRQFKEIPGLTDGLCEDLCKTL